MLTTRMRSCASGAALTVALAIASPAAAAAPAAAAGSTGASAVSAAAYKCDRTYYRGDALTAYGDSGNRVIEAQCRLVFWERLRAGDVDGRFGPKTRAAVIAFQKGLRGGACGNVDVDGIVGPVTWYFLRHGCG